MRTGTQDSRSAEHRLTEVIADMYGLTATAVRVPAGTVTDNFIVQDQCGQRWFAKVYRDPSTLAQEQAAIDLAVFARTDGVPVPRVHRTLAGGHIGEAQGVALSLWDYVADAETAERGLTGERWENVGIVLGKLHRRLASHPAHRPTVRPATRLYDLAQAQVRYDRLIETYQRLEVLDEDQEWALNAALQRRSLLPQAQAILQNLPPLTVQILHGDLASPNLLMRGNDVAAIIDFQPPTPQYLAWEVARIGCDPQSILADDDWPTGLSRLLNAY